MRILLVHNRYQRAGGEDAVFRAERALLESRGHEVVTHERSNLEVAGYGPWRKAMLAPRAVWAADSRRQLAERLARERPDVAHFHNTFPLISPAAYGACRDAGVPVVQTLHNYRLLCSNAMLLRGGRVCEDCLGRRLPWPSVAHACYHESRCQTAAVAAVQAIHRALGTWRECVDLYVALTRFALRKFVEGGLPEEKLVVKPNFVHPDPQPRDGSGEHALFLGRLSPEKGVETLLEAARLVARVPIRIAGEGPLAERVRAALAGDRRPSVRFLGSVAPDRALGLLKSARCLVVPSEWYEGFPMVVAEAFACGVPVIAARIGSLAEIVDDERSGLHFEAGDPRDLAAKLAWAWDHPEALARMGKEARREYEERYSPERSYGALIDVYREAQRRGAR